MSFKRNRQLLLLFATSLGLMAPATLTLLPCANNAACAAADTEMADSLSLAIRKARVIDPNSPLMVTLVSQAEATVTCQKPDKGTTDDMKIAAVLVAKTVIDASKGAIKRVKLIFSGGADSKSALALSVSIGDVMAFGSGKESRAELLASLALEKVETNTVLSHDPYDKTSNDVLTALVKLRIKVLSKYKSGRFESDTPGLKEVHDQLANLWSVFQEGKFRQALPAIDIICIASDSVKKYSPSKKPVTLATTPPGSSAPGSNPGITSPAAPLSASTTDAVPQNLVSFKNDQVISELDRICRVKIDEILAPDVADDSTQELDTRVSILRRIQQLEKDGKTVVQERAAWNDMNENWSTVRSKPDTKEKLKDLSAAVGLRPAKK